MDLLDDYEKTVEAIHRYFGYKEDWVVIPIDDRREMHWKLYLNKRDGGRVVYAPTALLDSGDVYYEDEIYTQRFLKQWVYRGEDYTMICVDTHTDGNKFLAIFSNALKED